jgi:hypothetical protein
MALGWSQEVARLPVHSRKEDLDAVSFKVYTKEYTTRVGASF